MRTLSKNSARRRTWIAVMGLLLVAGGVWFALRLADTEVGASAQPTSEVNRESTTKRADLPDPAPIESTARVPETARAPAAATPRPAQVDVVVAPAQDPAQDPASEVWELVRRLEELSKSPETFHGPALEVTELLTVACARVEHAAPETDASPPISRELLTRVVLDIERSPLVRGAVYLATATLLPEGEFWPVFEGWFADASATPLELLRAAALASTRKGQPAPCKRTLSLRRLAALPTGEGSALPGVYPLELEQIAPAAACVTLRNWLDAADPRKSRFQLGAAPPTEERELASVADYFTTVEVLYCVWAHQCLVDASVERDLIHAALLTSKTPQSGDLISLRVALFVLHSLSECDRDLARAALAASASDNPVVASVANMMRGLALAGIALPQVDEIEALRYASSGADAGELMGLLIEAGETLKSIPGTATAEREQAIAYLLSLAADENVSSLARGSALLAVLDGASWSQIKSAAQATLMGGGDALQNALAVSALVEGAAASAERRNEALALLRQIVANSPSEAARDAAQQSIAELDP